MSTNNVIESEVHAWSHSTQGQPSSKDLEVAETAGAISLAAGVVARRARLDNAGRRPGVATYPLSLSLRVKR